MSTENANLHDEAARGYLKEILVFDEMERLRLARQVLCGIFVISVGVLPPTLIGIKASLSGKCSSC
jgi:hypothetical protein